MVHHNVILLVFEIFKQNIKHFSEVKQIRDLLINNSDFRFRFFDITFLFTKSKILHICKDGCQQFY